jgi:outer membrane protein TolC
MRWLAKSAVLAVILAGVAANAPHARAQLSLGSAVEMALRNDPRVKAAEANVTRAQAVLSEVHDAYVPTVGIGGGYGKSTGPPLGLPTVFSIASESLVFNFAQNDNIRAAQAGLESAKLSLREAKEQVEEDVAVTYVSLAAAQELKTALDDEEGYAKRLQTIVNERETAGLDTQIDLVKSKRNATQIHLLVLQQEDSISDQEAHLIRSLGLTGRHIEGVQNSIPAVPELHDLTRDNSLSFGVQAAFEEARSHRETALAEGKYLYRPAISMVGNYSRLNTSPSESNFLVYYPTFAGKSNNDAAIAIQIQIPLFDRAHQARAQEASAEAKHAMFEAESQKNQFLDEREKLRHNIAELATRAELANDDREIAKMQLNAVLAQLSANNAATGATPMTPKDEQNARLDERQKYADYLNTQQELEQATIRLMRQTGQLDEWLQNTLHTTAAQPAINIKP